MNARLAIARLGACALALTAFVQPQAQTPPGDPTLESLEAELGSFVVESVAIAREDARGYGGATVYHPKLGGGYGVVAIAPGYTARQEHIAWMGPRLASRGFVVVTIDTFTTADPADSRARQLQAALDEVVRRSRTEGDALHGKADGQRLAVIGDSLGGGGALAAAQHNPALKAAVPLVPYHTVKHFPQLKVPTLIIGGQADTISVPADHALLFYESIPATTPKAYREFAGATHFFPHQPQHYPALGRHMIAWLKRFVDGDTRYGPLLCGPAGADARGVSALSADRRNCPY